MLNLTLDANKTVIVNQKDNVLTKPIYMKFGGTNIFLFDNINNYGLKIMFTHSKGTYAFLHKTNPKQNLPVFLNTYNFSNLDEPIKQISDEDDNLFIKHINLLAKYKLTPKIFSKTKVKINGYVLTAYIVEKVNILSTITENEINLVRENMLKFIAKYNVYASKNFPSPLLDDKAENFGVLNDGTLVFIDMFAWNHLFKPMTAKYKYNLLNNFNLGEGFYDGH